MDRYDKADAIAVIGMALAAVDMGSLAPTNIELLGVGGLGLAALAIVSNLYHKHKGYIVSKVDTVRHKIFKSEHKHGDEEGIENALDAVVDVAEDIADDGKLNNSND